MINKIKSNTALPLGLDIIRVLCGGIIISFGFEIFDPEQMNGYFEWLTKVGVPFPETMAYIGKLSELICGIFLMFGFLTKWSTIPLIITMCVINFIMLDGNIRSQPFYLLLLFVCFLILGSGKFSIDYLLERARISKVK